MGKPLVDAVDLGLVGYPKRRRLPRGQIVRGFEIVGDPFRNGAEEFTQGPVVQQEGFNGAVAHHQYRIRVLRISLFSGVVIEVPRLNHCPKFITHIRR